MARPSAREKLMDCAEELFAKHGVEGVSLRSINSAAGLSAAALHYHFGSQQALLEALLERRMPGLMARRRELLDALESADSTPTARGVLESLSRPLIELVDAEPIAGMRYLQLLHRLQIDGSIDRAFVVARWREGVERLLPLFRRALPSLPDSVIELRMDLATQIMLGSLASQSNVESAALEAHQSAILDFLSGAMEAPASAPPGA